jgi:dihydroorotate dehydrogenase
MSMNADRALLLPSEPELPADLIARIKADHDRFAGLGLPDDLDDYLQGAYGLDMTASYAGSTIRNPWGKASGQLSLNAPQIVEAADAGLGLVVLKTVIARDPEGEQSMSAWAIRESRMIVEPILGRQTGIEGWTVTWKGRGWWQSFDDYLELVREGCAIGRRRGLLVVPSVKYHLPARADEPWKEGEYVETTRALMAAYRSAGGSGPLPIEKDFSPTLAGSDRAEQCATVLHWLRHVPGLIRRSAIEDGSVRVGLKLFNSLEDDAFQRAMLAEVHGEARPDFLVYANRLFDPDREFDRQRGVAYGGPDLSDRNLRLLSALRFAQAAGEIARSPVEISATGDISSGRFAVEYALRGCTSFQIHTLFQLPATEFAMRVGSRVQRALHRLYFDPRDGFIVWMIHAAGRLGIARGGRVNFLDLARLGAASALTRRDLDTRAG